jgi:hypothetical protein
MAFDMHAWLRFSLGLLAGCWIGVAIGCGLTLLLASRRLRQLQSANALLRVKLRAREKPVRSGTGPLLVVPGTGTHKSSGSFIGRAAGVR